MNNVIQIKTTINAINQITFVYGNWQKTQQELDAVNNTGHKTFTGKKKLQLAKHIGTITQQQFENDLKTIFETLSKSWKLAH